MIRVPLALVLMLTSGCASALAVPEAITPPDPPQSFLVVGLSIENARRICVEQPWKGGEAQFDCLSVGELRQIVFQRLIAENTR